MDILQISYFSKVYETTNYAHAAESLCVSRQGLRKVMRNLEREVGQPLFVNVANRLQPTEAAHRLYKASRIFVEGFRELEDAVAAMKLSQKTEVRLGGTYDSDDVFTTAEWRAFRSYGGADKKLDTPVSGLESACTRWRPGRSPWRPSRRGSA